MERATTSPWTGSDDLVRKQIAARWSEAEANDYDPKHDCFTFAQWRERGCRVKKGEKALRSFVLIETKDENGNLIDCVPKQVYLFYFRQVTKMTGAQE